VRNCVKSAGFESVAVQGFTITLTIVSIPAETAATDGSFASHG
jgi:hypothetical protein